MTGNKVYVQINLECREIVNWDQKGIECSLEESHPNS